MQSQSHNSTPRPVQSIAEQIGLRKEQIEPYGHFQAKVPLDSVPPTNGKGNTILVTAISPTLVGEGKTTVAIGLADGLQRIGKKVILTLREPSMGPVFGRKGGGCGGGKARVIPHQSINLGFTGDFFAVERAHNLLASLIDNSVFHHRTPDFQTTDFTWPRAMDLNDRFLRQTITGLGGRAHGLPKENPFIITAASEIMAILSLANSYQDLNSRLARMLIGSTSQGSPIFASDINGFRAMAVLLRDAFKPNLVQTLEGTPCLIHCGPFANIAQGTNSRMATRLGQNLADYVVTEAGFGSDLGAEKFFNIKCADGSINTKAIVLVVTCQALKYQAGVDQARVKEKDPEAVKKSLAHLDRHINGLKHYGLPIILCHNRFPWDHPEEVQLIKQHAKQQALSCATLSAFSDGSIGAQELAQLVVEACSQAAKPSQTIYQPKDPIETKIAKVTQTIYGAKSVNYSDKAKRDLQTVYQFQMDQLPICIAKTPHSFTDDPAQRGCPQDFTITIDSIKIAAGAGFVIPITGNMQLMPGLPKTPRADQIYLSDAGEIHGIE